MYTQLNLVSEFKKSWTVQTIPYKFTKHIEHKQDEVIYILTCEEFKKFNKVNNQTRKEIINNFKNNFNN